jgi:hypothetical protein
MNPESQIRTVEFIETTCEQAPKGFIRAHMSPKMAGGGDRMSTGFCECAGRNGGRDRVPVEGDCSYGVFSGAPSAFSAIAYLKPHYAGVA